MTLSLTMFTRLIAKIAVPRHFSRQAWVACAFAAVLAAQAQAQLTEGLVYNGGNAIGSSALAANIQYSDASTVPNGESGEIFVGPGGETSPLNVPSAMDGSRQPVRGKLVSQPWATGPFVQSPPVHQDAGIPCPCDEGCDFSYYGSVEALYFRRDYDERFTLSQFRIPPFDYEWAGRVTFGRVMDCVNGYEFSYAGPFKWERAMTATSAGGNLQSRLSTSGFLPTAISAFDNATLHSQQYQARLNTYEVNRRWWAWDIFSTLIGIRVVDYREDYAFVSSSAAGNGLYQASTRNAMVGPQIGGELNQPVGLRTLVGIRGKGALLANFSRNQVALQNAGLNVLGSSDSDVDVSGLIEVGAYAKYSITPSIRLMGGYEFWYLPQVATVPSQGLNVVGPGTAAKVNADDDLFLHGASFGAQILY